MIYRIKIKPAHIRMDKEVAFIPSIEIHLNRNQAVIIATVPPANCSKRSVFINPLFLINILMKKCDTSTQGIEINIKPMIPIRIFSNFRILSQMPDKSIRATASEAVRQMTSMTSRFKWAFSK